jgi:hypothetical protein
MHRQCQNVTTKTHNTNKSVKLYTAKSLNIYLAKKDEDLLKGQKYDGNNMLFNWKWKIEDRQFVTLGREGKTRMNTMRPRDTQMKQVTQLKAVT